MPKGKVVIGISDWRALQDALLLTPETNITDVIAKAEWMRVNLYTPLNHAAPDLLAACEAVVEAGQLADYQGLGFDVTFEYTYNALCKATEMAQKVIEKARATT